jgi:AcrR family transcriptional regulator
LFGATADPDHRPLDFILNGVQDLNVVQELGRRARNRLERHGAFVRAAKRVAFTEGLASLTMQRLADEVDCAVGTVYTYFPSKSALVAEVQREAIELLDESCARFEVAFAERNGRAVPAVRHLALVAGYARFWVDTFDTFPEEARLLQLLMSATTIDQPTVIDDVDVSRVVPAALKLLGRMEVALEQATAAGALDDGDAMERTIVLVASLNGVLLLDNVARVDPDLFDGRRLARTLVEDLLRGWGADGRSLSAAVDRVAAMAATGPLATRSDTSAPAPIAAGTAAEVGAAGTTDPTATSATTATTATDEEATS